MKSRTKGPTAVRRPHAHTGAHEVQSTGRSAIQLCLCRMLGAWFGLVQFLLRPYQCVRRWLAGYALAHFGSQSASALWPTLGQDSQSECGARCSVLTVGHMPEQFAVFRCLRPLPGTEIRALAEASAFSMVAWQDHVRHLCRSEMYLNPSVVRDLVRCAVWHFPAFPCIALWLQVTKAEASWPPPPILIQELIAGGPPPEARSDESESYVDAPCRVTWAGSTLQPFELASFAESLGSQLQTKVRDAGSWSLSGLLMSVCNLSNSQVTAGVPAKSDAALSQCASSRTVPCPAS